MKVHTMFSKYSIEKREIPYFLKIRKEILRRLPFDYSYGDYLMTSFLHTCNCFRWCIKDKGRLKKMQLRRDMFDKAVVSLENTMDITRILRKLQKFTIMKQILLKDQHSSMIKFFKNNTLNVP
jgi:hypothetical protein